MTKQRAEGNPNRGSIAIDRLCGDEYGAQKRIAAELDADETQFSRWRRGVRKPEWPMRLKIQEKIGIPAPAWDEEPEAEEPAPSSSSTPTPGTEKAS